jgi:hypothetical protein
VGATRGTHLAATATYFGSPLKEEERNMKDATRMLSIGLLGAGSLALGAAAFGQTRQFDDFDKNGDDRITLDEWHGGIAGAGVFSGRDVNDDRRLDENEFGALDFDEEFDAWDANDDDYLDDDEYYDGAFDYFDEDENGHWDGNEWDDAGDRGFWDV